MSTKQAKLRAIGKFNKLNTKCVQLRLNFKTDADVIEKLDNVPSKMGYIKNLIRKDIKNDEL